MKSILFRFAGPSPSSRGNASAPKEKAAARRGSGLEIKMECRRQCPRLQLQYQGLSVWLWFFTEWYLFYGEGKAIWNYNLFRF